VFSGDVLKGKRILVTGGGTGLGKEMSVGFAAHGAHVFICGRRKDVLDNAVGEIRKRSRGQADAVVANVRDPGSVEKMLAEIWITGPLTGLVNNAGANFLAPTESLSPRGYEAIRSTIMDGSFYAAQACGKRWIAAGLPGVIISNLVTWVWTGSAYVVPAAMAKAAVHAMTMSLAVEWGPKGIRVNAIAPGPFPTENAWDKLNPLAETGVGRHASRRSAVATIRQDGRIAQSPDLPDVGRVQLHHRRYDQHRWRASSGGAEHLRGALETFAGRLAACPGGHPSVHAQGKGRQISLRKARGGIGNYAAAA
jgi:NAD(P)-dependent dehydrogenase (short-subunit alcohol dehydrogenase family)